MKHLALYRKYRPVTFDEVIDQEHITKTLASQVKNNNIHHAYLFTGTRGTGKTSCAKIFAKAINCLNPKNGSPCLECDVCKAYESFNMDIVELDAASNTSVDDIREIIENTKFMPVNGKYKVFIIDEVHMLSISAFNALLKTLEEPPEHVIFILATTEVHKIPATILSRVMRFDFHLVTTEGLCKLITRIFEEENIKADNESIMAIAKAGEGSVRDALSIADCVAAYSYKDITYSDVLSALGQSDKKTLLDIVDAILDGDIDKLFNLTDKLYKSGKNISVVVKDLTLHFRDLLIIKSCANANELLSLPQDIFSEFDRQAKRAERSLLLKCLQKFSSIENELRYALSPKVLLEISVLECLRLGQKTNVIPVVKVTVSNEGENKEEIKDDKAQQVKKEKVYDIVLGRKVWGQLLTSLRDNGDMFLFTLCSEITSVYSCEDELVVVLKDEALLAQLNSVSRQLADIVKNVFNLDLVIKKDRALQKIDETIAILTQYCGELLKIIR